MSYLSLREYGVIGNLGSALLISRKGSVDWACLPYMDSPSIFSAILDDNHGGRFQICPTGDFRSSQRYLEMSTVLETQFETTTGKGTLTDWMPVREHTCDPTLHRTIEVTEGEIQWTVECSPRFQYGVESSQVEIHQDGILFRGTQPGDLAVLKGSVPLSITSDQRCAEAQFTLRTGQQCTFSFGWGRQNRRMEILPFERTHRYWQNIAQKLMEAIRQEDSPFLGPWQDMAVRSGMTLKLLNPYYSGALVESPTTSIPTLLGGSRNWDYRYTWVRNIPLAQQAFNALGFFSEADALFQWLADIVIRDGAEGLQSIYTLDGGRFLPERELNLSGYVGSRPVRVGNLAARQFHLDLYGYVMLASDQYYSRHGKLPNGPWPKLAEIAEYTAQAWRRPDRGPWEIRSKPEHFVTPKVLCWVALDRVIHLSHAQSIPPPKRWLHEREILHRTICEQGYDEQKQSFIRSFGDSTVDASALLIPIVGFLPPDDPRIQSTVDAVQRELSDGVLIQRYKGTDISAEVEGAHLLSSFWYASCLALIGKVEEAVDRLAELVSYATPLGLFAEQADPYSGDPAGNFPCATSHLALICSALLIGSARSRKKPSSALTGFPLLYPEPSSQQSHVA